MHLRSRRFCDALHPPIIERTLARISAACYATSITESSSAASRKRLVLPRCSRSRSLADSNSALLSPHSWHWHSLLSQLRRDSLGYPLCRSAESDLSKEPS